jgi:alpha-amylase
MMEMATGWQVMQIGADDGPVGGVSDADVARQQRRAIGLGEASYNFARRSVVVAMVVFTFCRVTLAEDVSQPAILQMFEAKWDTIEDRMADIFATGYGQMWLPPPQRADTGNLSVGYDVFNRFDLGQPRNETLYGTETGLKTTVTEGHKADVKMYTDFIPNHNGYETQSNSTFVAQGGYPGFVMSLPTNCADQNHCTFGDFHDPSVSYTTDPVNGSLFGLIDIAQEANHQFIRQPTTAGNPDNIPAGTIYNKPDANNARFYPDQGQGRTAMNDPNTGGAFTRYNFNSNSPLAGDPVTENATGLLMRNMQWMIQTVGVDGFRIDAARHFPSWVMNYFDKAVFRSSTRTNLDGTIEPIFMFSEIADGSTGAQTPYLRKDLPNPLGISTSDTTVHGNRDVLDFPLFYAMVSNLSTNGTTNNWHNIRSASMDVADDGLHNGSAGVTFVDSHDNQSGGFPALMNVAYAYTLMLPGNAIVYENAKEFGNGRSFPHDEGGTANPISNNALGGSYWGDAVTTLVDIRNTHGRGDFKERWLDDAFNSNGFSNVYVYERSKSAIVALNSRNDSFVEVRNGVQTDFAPGTILVELTGNAADPTVDPSGVIPDTIKVDASGKVNLSIPSNNGQDHGYVIYGVAGPQGALSLSNRGTSQVLAGATPSISNTARLNDIDVVTSNSFTVQLNTTPVSLKDPDHAGQFVRDVHADGDTAMIKIDDGLNINGVPGIDNTTVGSTGYGFENFTTTRTPGYIWGGSSNIGSGSGTYAQTIDTTQLSEGRHYITVRAFRHRGASTGGDGGPSVFTDFKETIYVDRLPPVSAVVSFDPYASDPTNPNNRDLIVRSVDQTANNMHFLLDLPANLTNSQILAMVGAGTQAGYYDRDQYVKGYGVNYGNHVATVVTYEPTGNYNIQRFPGLFTATNSHGAGFGDMNFSNSYVTGDIRTNTGSVEDVLYSQNAKYSSAFDVNGDGLCDNRDLFLLGDTLVAAPTTSFGGGAKQSVLNSYTDLLLKRADVNSSGTSDAADMSALYSSFGTTTWTMDLNVDGVVDISDVQTMVTKLFRTVPGDFNLDGQVDGADYVVLRKNLGHTGATFLQGDATFDGVIGADDLQLWRANFGFVRQPLSAAGSGVSLAAVPEPAAWRLISICFVWAISLRRRMTICS